MTNKKESWINLSFIGLVQVVASFTLIFSILSVFDKYHRFLELSSHFKFQYLLASFSCAIILFLYKNNRFAITLLLVAVLNSTYVVPWYLSDSENTHDVGQTELAILHSNVYRDNDNYKGFIDMIKQENPDIFVMQEVNHQWLSEVQELENVYIHMYKTPRNDDFGIAIFSKYPFESVKKIKWIASDVPSIVATIIIAEQLITVVATHPLPPTSERYYLSRNAQINKIAEISRNHPGPMIVMGDLNITMWSHDYLTLELGTNLRNARKGFGLLASFPTQFLLPMFMIPIDHYLVSSHFVVNNLKVGEDIGSDHLPLIVKLGLKDIESQEELALTNPNNLVQ